MDFNNTTDKNGLIQECEELTGLGDTGISGNSTLLKRFTARLNQAIDEVMPLVLSFGDFLRFDDPNHTDKPIATFSLVSGQADYKFTTDDNSLNVLNMTHVRILTSSTATDYADLDRLTLDDPIVPEVMSPNTNVTGIPTHFLEHGNVLYLYPKPNYAATNGVKVYFERDPSYFASTDTTKEPGIPRPFHPILPKIASLKWLAINQPSNRELIAQLRDEIRVDKSALKALIATKNPTKNRITTKRIRHR